jgi:hypothetical protein
MVDDHRVDRLDLMAGLLELGDEVCDRLVLGIEVSRTPTSPNWNEPSTSTTFLPSSVAAATARLTARVVRPTPPFGLNTATTCPGSPLGVRLVPPAPPLASAATIAIRDIFSRSRA